MWSSVVRKVPGSTLPSGLHTRSGSSVTLAVRGVSSNTVPAVTHGGKISSRLTNAFELPVRRHRVGQRQLLRVKVDQISMRRQHDGTPALAENVIRAGESVGGRYGPNIGVRIVEEASGAFGYGRAESSAAGEDILGGSWCQFVGTRCRVGDAAQPFQERCRSVRGCSRPKNMPGCAARRSLGIAAT